MAFRSKSTTKLKETDSTGFSNRVGMVGGRLLTPEGTFNVRRSGIPFFKEFSFYHTLITMPWWQFHIMVLLAFMVLNTFFTALYLLIGTEYLVGMDEQHRVSEFWETFFFSAQTLTTVGYGRVNPMGFGSGLVASLESLTGLMGFALGTGLLYGRFARPVMKLQYSKNIVVAPFKDGTGLMFRLVNMRKHQLSDISIVLMMAWIDHKSGSENRKYFELPLEVSRINVLSLPWTVVHPIDGASPLFGLTQEELDRTDAEFIVQLRCYDESFAQQVVSRTSYKFYEVEWGAKFTSMFGRSDDGHHTVVQINKIDDFEPIALSSSLQQAPYLVVDPSGEIQLEGQDLQVLDDAESAEMMLEKMVDLQEDDTQTGA